MNRATLSRLPKGAKPLPASPVARAYPLLIEDIAGLLETARRASARAVNALMTATYWEVGRRIVEFEQHGGKRARYGEALLKRLAQDLSARAGKGFSRQNLQNMRSFYLTAPPDQICQTLSGKLPAPQNSQTVSGESNPKDAGIPAPSALPFALSDLARAFPLPWSHYVLLVSRSRSPEAFVFYQSEALRGGWSVRQLQRQIDSQFYERTALSRNKAALLAKGARAQPGDTLGADEEIRHPLVLEFLGLRDEYSEIDLEDALIRHLETFLLELGNDFTFVGRQRRLRIDDEWYRVDLLLFHRRLRCLVVVDLKLGRFTHADAGQMTVYLNYAREHWTQPGENPPVGIILCSSQSTALVRYATEGLADKLLVRDYLTLLPEEKTLATELEKTRAALQSGQNINS